MGLSVNVVGIVVLLLLWVLYRILTGTWNLLKLIDGADGRPSTSKLQFFLWTVVVLFAYVVVYVAKGTATGDWGAVNEIPRNLLIAMGLSATTMVTAKAITVSYVASGKVIKQPSDPSTTKTVSGVMPQAAGPGAIIQDDEGVPDLSKAQMVAWTLIAIAVYIIGLELQKGVPTGLPDIDGALMVLMGLGQGAYIGKKLTTTTVPRLTGVSPAATQPGTQITISGSGFGDKQDGSEIMIDGNPLSAPAIQWQDTEVVFTLPAKRPDGTEWQPGQRVTIGLIVGGQASANILPVTVMPSS